MWGFLFYLSPGSGRCLPCSSWGFLGGGRCPWGSNKSQGENCFRNTRSLLMRVQAHNPPLKQSRRSTGPRLEKRSSRCCICFLRRGFFLPEQSSFARCQHKPPPLSMGVLAQACRGGDLHQNGLRLLSFGHPGGGGERSGCDAALRAACLRPQDVMPSPGAGAASSPLGLRRALLQKRVAQSGQLRKGTPGLAKHQANRPPPR